MEELERKRLHWQKVTAVVCILLLIVVTASSALAFVGVLIIFFPQLATWLPSLA